MKRIVIDTNIIFSGIVNLQSKIGDLLLNSSTSIAFYSCHYLLEELARHQNKLMSISNLELEEIDIAKSLIFKSVKFVSEELIPFEIWKNAAQIVRDVDMDDIAFVALNEYLGDSLIWSGDMKLIKGIAAVGYSKCISTEELYNYRTANE